MAQDPPTHRPLPRLRRWALGTLSLLLLVVWVGVALVRQELRHVATDNLRRQVDTEALRLEEHLSRSLDSVQGLFQALALYPPGPRTQADLSDLPELVQLTLSMPLVRSVSLVDERGLVHASTNPDNLGQTAPPNLRPPPAALLRPGEVQLGGLQDQRDVGMCPECNAAQGYWAAYMDVLVGGQPWRWVLAINTGYFENFWYRVMDNRHLSVLMLDRQGTLLVSHHASGHEANLAELRGWYNSEITRRDRQQLERRRPSTLLAAYRGANTHPVAILVAADDEALDLQAAVSDRHLWLSATAISACLALLALLFLRWHRGYEQSVLELGNQSRGVNAHLMVSVSDPSGQIVSANDRFCEVTGYSRDELLGQNHRMFNSGLHPSGFYQQFWGTLQAGQIWKGVLRNRAKDGRLYWVNATIIPYLNADGRVLRYTAFYSDITEAIALRERLDMEHHLREELTELNQRLQQDALTDPLTGATNRRGFQAFMASVLADSLRLQQPLALLSLDLDHFKQVNDTHGHLAGDEVLRDASRRWRAQLRSSDLLARLGGEEFCVVLPATASPQAQLVANKLLHAMVEHPFRISTAQGDVDLNVTVSIGLTAVHEVAGLGADDLLHAADEALYQAKRQGRNRICESTPALAGPPPSGGR